MREKGRGCGVIPWVLAVVLPAVLVGGLLWPGGALGIEPPGQPAYDVEELIEELQRLTGWDCSGLPRPRVEVLDPSEFRRRVRMPGDMVIFGYYKTGTQDQPDLILLNEECSSRAGLFNVSPEVFCRGTLLHELVHWVQTHQTSQHPKGRIERELEAHQWEQRYLAQMARSGGPKPHPRSPFTGPREVPLDLEEHVDQHWLLNPHEEETPNGP
ncbi:MAG: hypothetical protein HY347_08785 [candidate division NC10 bacterium]|nr:hypothetical protein [candidate division NC10 bacterium]